MAGLIKVVAIVVCFLAVFGLLHGILGSLSGGGFYALWRDGGTSGWPWWYYVLALPALGAVWVIFEVVVEGVGSVIFAPYTWRYDPDPWKRLAYWTYVFMTTCIAIAMLSSPWWLRKLAEARNVI